MITEIEAAAAITCAGAAWITWKHAADHVRAHGAHRIAWRLATGRHTGGDRHTSATFWAPSDGRVHGMPSHRIRAPHHRAGVVNLGRRAAGAGVAAAALAGYAADPVAAEWAGGTAASLGLAYAAWRAVRAGRRAIAYRRHLSPLAAGLAPVLGVTPAEAAESLDLAPGWERAAAGEVGRIRLPVSMAAAGDELAALGHLVNSRLPGEYELEPRMRGRAPYLLIRAVPQLPARVLLRDHMEAVDATDRGQVIGGVTRSGEPYRLNLCHGDSVHLGLCWASGRGKSTALQQIVAQVLYRDPGATGVVIDPKDVSLAPLKGVPGLDFRDDLDDIQSMWDGIYRAAAVMKDRYAILKKDPSAEFPLHLVVLEEANSFAVASRTEWGQMKIRGEIDKSAGAYPSFWAEAVAPIAWRGRQVNVILLVVAQTLQDRFLGGLSLRPSLGTVSLSGWKANQWANVVGTPYIRPQKGRGRAIVVEGEREVWTQFLYDDPAFLRELAMTGRTGLHVADSSRQAAA